MNAALLTTTFPGPPVIAPSITLETATRKVRAAEGAWNSRDPDRMALAYNTEDSVWRNRGEFLAGRDQLRASRAAQVGAGTRLPAGQGALGVHREPHRRPLPLRVARQRGELVPQLRQRDGGRPSQGPRFARASSREVSIRPQDW